MCVVLLHIRCFLLPKNGGSFIPKLLKSNTARRNGKRPRAAGAIRGR
ncbi:hypothetical protein SL1157_0614 [Ruegeria lacuscaerulensis ITI-1157]|nr:hypothetical protein SL1157_0614 [Ruegeria lacuscaerulensis ITI-1157]